MKIIVEWGDKSFWFFPLDEPATGPTITRANAVLLAAALRETAMQIEERSDGPR